MGRVQRKNTVALQTKSRITGMVDLVAVLHHTLVEQCCILDLPLDLRVDTLKTVTPWWQTMEQLPAEYQN